MQERCGAPALRDSRGARVPPPSRVPSMRSFDKHIASIQSSVTRVALYDMPAERGPYVYMIHSDRRASEIVVLERSTSDVEAHVAAQPAASRLTARKRSRTVKPRTRRALDALVMPLMD